VFSKIPGGIVETRSHTGSIIARRVATINRAPVSWRKKKKKRRKGGLTLFASIFFFRPLFFLLLLTGRGSLRPAGYKNNKPIQVHQILSCFSSNSRFKKKKKKKKKREEEREVGK
jgi:hypothetical protein